MCILINLGWKFELKLKTLIFGMKIAQKGYFYFFGSNLTKSKYFLFKMKKKKQHHDWILRNQISLDTNFYPTKVSQKRYFLRKTEKVNFIIEFCR